MTALYYILLTFFLVLSLMLILLILIQKGRGGGLSAAFGGAGGNTAFGQKTGDVLTWATSIVFGVFLLLGISLNLIANNIQTRENDPRRQDTPGAAAAAKIGEELGLPSTPVEPAPTTPAVTPPTTAPAALAPTTAPASAPIPTTAPAALAPTTAPTTQP